MLVYAGPMTMPGNSVSELQAFGRAAAEAVVGPEAVEEVEVRPGERSGGPVYYFSFLIDRERAQQRAGLIFIRILQQLRDGLLAKGDPHFPVVRILDRADWDRRRVNA
jgi:hypothetical protein